VYRAVLVYRHHSTPRCSADRDNLDYPGCSNSFNPLGSYDARVWTVSPPVDASCAGSPGPAGYRETFTLKPGTYEVSWIDPETTLPYTGTPAIQTITCSTFCTITTPVYKFDILLRLVKR
ncbi:MAG TPA: hypothetical protein DD490_20485, partial [Acidobacteria bacterium]|nr:hypothetical protein [Acidobacteriota bacterium]